MLAARKKIGVLDVMAQKELILSMDKRASFDIILSGSVKKLIHGNIEYSNMLSIFSMDELRFIRKVKNEIIKNCQIYEKTSGKIPSYYCPYVNWSKNLPYNSENLVEIDISGAYWQGAFQGGYISESVYNEGFNYRKKVKLASLGSIAKREIVFKYENGKFLRTEPTKRHEYSKAFFNISRYIYDVMNLCAISLGNSYLFFWVDAIFFENSPKNVNLVTEILRDCDMDFKQYNIEKFNFDKKTGIATVSSNGHERKIRKFNFKIQN